MGEKKINGRTFSVQPMLAKEALVKFAVLTKVIGPALPELASAMSFATEGRKPPAAQLSKPVEPDPATGKGEGTGADPSARSTQAEEASNRAVFDALQKIIGGINPEAFATLVEELIEKAEVKEDGGDYRQVIMDQDFTGDLPGLIELLAFVLKVQYGNFWAGLVAAGRTSLKKRA